MAFIGESEVRRVREASDLVQVMAEYAPLVKAGRQFKLCCPFHQERSPSCVLYPESQHYHCYGCGAHGDVITLVREKESLDFADAVELLARRAGIEIQYERHAHRSSVPRSEREPMIAAMEFATKFYEHCLWNDAESAPARKYLAGRNLGEDVCRRFRVGWSPGRGRFFEAARREGFDFDVLQKLDLARDYDGRLADRFYERVMFPICDRFGGPIAFTARLLPEAERAAKEAGKGVGKYVNTGDTPLFKKSSVVFNLHRARMFCRDAGRLLVMEGPTDVMAADQGGVGECVAVMGTAFTPEHARQLGNLVGSAADLTLLFDGDTAGRTRTLSAIKVLLSLGIGARVATLEDEMDPAEVFDIPDGRARFDAMVAKNLGEIDHLMRSLAPNPPRMEPKELFAVTDQILDCLRQIKDRDLRRIHLESLATWMGLPIDRLERRLIDGAAAGPILASPGTQTVLDPVRDLVLHLLVRSPDLRHKAFEEWECSPDLFPTPFDRLVVVFLESPDLAPGDLLLRTELREEPVLATALSRYISQETASGGRSLANPEKLLKAQCRLLAIERLERELDELQHALQRAEMQRDQKAVQEHFARLMALQERRRQLEAE